MRNTFRRFLPREYQVEMLELGSEFWLWTLIFYVFFPCVPSESSLYLCLELSHIYSWLSARLEIFLVIDRALVLAIVLWTLKDCHNRDSKNPWEWKYINPRFAQYAICQTILPKHSGCLINKRDEKSFRFCWHLQPQRIRSASNILDHKARTYYNVMIFVS